MISRSQVDKLGQRLKEGDPTADDITLLDAYRRDFAQAYALTIGDIVNLGYSATGRPSKSTRSIIDKLRRESCRLSQIQDIAGCRVVVPGILEQDQLVGKLSSLWNDVLVVDRRRQPSHGYRAVHVIRRDKGFAVEVQVRTTIQQKWAETSEKLADRFGSTVKYGGAPGPVHAFLDETSKSAFLLEQAEASLAAEMNQLNPLLDSLLQSVGPEQLSRAQAVAMSLRKTASHFSTAFSVHHQALFRLLESFGSLDATD